MVRSVISSFLAIWLHKKSRWVEKILKIMEVYGGGRPNDFMWPNRNHQWFARNTSRVLGSIRKNVLFLIFIFWCIFMLMKKGLFLMIRSYQILFLALVIRETQSVWHQHEITAGADGRSCVSFGDVGPSPGVFSSWIPIKGLLWWTH